MLIIKLGIIGMMLVFVWASAQSQNPTPTPSISGKEKQTKPQKPNQKAAPEQRGTEQSPVFVKIPRPSTQADREYEAYEKHEKPANERRIAYATIALALITFVLALFTAFLWNETRKLWKGAQGAEAPFILPDDLATIGFLGAPMANNPPQIIYGFRNHGKSPAIIRRWRDFSIFTDRLPIRPPFQERWSERPEQYIPIAPGEAGGHLSSRIPVDATREQILEVLSRHGRLLGLGDRWLYVIGEVEYEDIFSTVRVQGYCLRITSITQSVEGIGLGEDVRFWREGGRPYNERREGRAQD